MYIQPLYPHILMSLVWVGMALTHVLEENLRAASGARAQAGKVLVLLTDGKSQDDAITVAQTLKEAGIYMFAIGKPAEQPNYRMLVRFLILCVDRTDL